jgi:hypothetical protein
MNGPTVASDPLRRVYSERVTPLAALRALLLVLVLAAVAWFIRSRRWREQRLLPLGLGLLGALVLLARRVGAEELLIIAAVIVIPGILFAPRRR